MTSPNKLNELNHAEDLSCDLLARLDWSFVSREALATEWSHRCDVLLIGRLTDGPMLPIECKTEDEADRVIFALPHVEDTGAELMREAVP